MNSTHGLVVLFLILFVFQFVLERFLAVFNLRHILAHRDAVPELLKNALSHENYERSIRYAKVRTRFDHVEACFDAALALVYLFSGVIPWGNARIQHLGLGTLASGVLLIGGFLFVNSLLSLPLEWHETFHIEAQFGFNQTTWQTFWTDKLKSGIVSLVLGVPVLAALLWFIQHSGSTWWIWGAMFVIAFQLALVVVYPFVIAPLFNKFTPLEEGEAKQQLRDLAESCLFKAKDIFVMDGSRRSTHSNAYFTGLGKARRIVLYDTLLQQLSLAELKAVLAHEIGHFKLGHIVKMIFLSSVLTFLGFFLCSALLSCPPLFQAFGFDSRADAAGLLLIGLIAPAFTFWVKPLFSRLSRKHEYEADAFAASVTRDPRNMGGALLKLFEKNLSTLLPHPAYSAYHYSHPTLLERLAALKWNIEADAPI